MIDWLIDFLYSLAAENWSSEYVPPVNKVHSR